jgi:hypothetical protein
MLNLPHATVQDAIAKLREIYFPGFHVLPYNRFDVNHSPHWWLSPSREKAAFRHGKVMFTTSDDWVEPGHVFVGFNVEKGILQAAGGRPNEVMDGTWFWHRFLTLANVPLAAAIEQAHEAMGGTVQIYVNGGVLGGGSRFESLLFDVELHRLRPKRYERRDGILAGLAASTDFGQFSDALRALDGAGTAWHWMDILVGSSFTLNANGPDNTGKCAAMLHPFRQWMRAVR